MTKEIKISDVPQKVAEALQMELSRSQHDFIMGMAFAFFGMQNPQERPANCSGINQDELEQIIELFKLGVEVAKKGAA